MKITTATQNSTGRFDYENSVLSVSSVVKAFRQSEIEGCLP